MANQIYDIAYRAEDLDVSQVGNFNNFDRIIDRFTGLLEIYKAGAQYQGGGLNAYKIKIGADTPGEAAEALREFETEDSLSIRQIRKWAGDIKEAFRRGDVDAQDQLRLLHGPWFLLVVIQLKLLSSGRLLGALDSNRQ